jgi:hypothetical protein
MEHVTHSYDPPRTHPDAIAIADSTLQIFTWVTVIAGLFTALFLWLLKVVPVPVMI